MQRDRVVKEVITNASRYYTTGLIETLNGWHALLAAVSPPVTVSLLRQAFTTRKSGIVWQRFSPLATSRAVRGRVSDELGSSCDFYRIALPVKAPSPSEVTMQLGHHAAHYAEPEVWQRAGQRQHQFTYTL